MTSSKNSSGSRSQKKLFMAGQQRTGLAVCLAVVAVASSCASAVVLQVPPTTAGVLGINKLISPATRQQRHGSLSAAQPLAENERSGEDDGGSTALAIAVAVGGTGVASGTTGAAAAPTAVAVENPAKQKKFDLPAADKEAAKPQVQAVTRRAAESVARSLPGTWWTAGLPKWMHLVRRRMVTKEDWMHLHAASGAVFLVGSSVYMVHVVGMELFAGMPQLDTASALPLCMLGTGLANTLSSMPMATTRSWYLTGMMASVIQLWSCWYVSGVYPACLAPADPWVASAFASVLVIACVEAEETIQSEKRKRRELLAMSGRSTKPSGHVGMRAGDHVEGDTMNRYGNLANLVFTIPHLYATLVGSGWVDRLAESYPAAPALLFHSYFSLVITSALALLAPTLYQRRLIDAKGMSTMQFLTVAPLVMSMLDAGFMGSAATNNPIEIYLGFLY